MEPPAPPPPGEAVRAYSSMVCRKLAGGFSICGNFVSRNIGQSFARRYMRSRSSPWDVARLYTSSAFIAFILPISKNRSMSRMMPSFTIRYTLNESVRRSFVPAITTSLSVRFSFTASHSSSRLIIICTRGNVSMSSVSSHERSAVGDAESPPEPAAILSSRGILSRFATYSSR